MKHYITDEDIDRVSIKNLPYHDENTCKGIEAYWIVQRLIIIVMNVVYF